MEPRGGPPKQRVTPVVCGHARGPAMGRGPAQASPKLERSAENQPVHVEVDGQAPDVAIEPEVPVLPGVRADPLHELWVHMQDHLVCEPTPPVNAVRVGPLAPPVQDLEEGQPVEEGLQVLGQPQGDLERRLPCGLEVQLGAHHPHQHGLRCVAPCNATSGVLVLEAEQRPGIAQAPGPEPGCLEAGHGRVGPAGACG